MKKALPLAVAGVVAATLSFATIGAKAQTPAAGQPAAAGAPGGGPPSSAEGPPPGAPEGAHLPFLMVTSIEVLRSPRGGGMDIIRLEGASPAADFERRLDRRYARPDLPGHIAVAG